MKKTKALVVLLVALIIAIIIVQTISGAVISTTTLNDDGNHIPVLPANVTWEKIYGGPQDDRIYDAVAADDGYLVVGSTRSIVANTTVGWALKINDDGNAVWNTSYLVGFGTEIRYALNLTDGFLLVGNEILSNGGFNGFVARINSDGTLVWQEVIGDNQTDELYSAIAAPDGFVLLGLNSTNAGLTSQAWVVKINLYGSVLWDKTFSLAADTVARSGAMSPDGDYMIAGFTDPRAAGSYDFLLMKVDPSGNLIWNQTYGGSGSQEVQSMTTVPGGYVLVGNTQTQGGSMHAWVVKVDLNGNLLWSTIVGGKNADSPAYVTPASNGGYLVAGFTFSWGAGNRDFWLFEISASGKVEWSCTQGDPGYQEAYAVIQAASDQYVMFGWTDPPGIPALIGKAQYEWYIVKLSPRQQDMALTELTFTSILLAVGILITAVITVLAIKRQYRKSETGESIEAEKIGLI